MGQKAFREKPLKELQWKMCSLCNWLLGFCSFPKHLVLYFFRVQNYPVLWENRYLDSTITISDWNFLSFNENEFQFSKSEANVENDQRGRFSVLHVDRMCLMLSGPNLGSWVGCGDCGLVLDRLWTLLFTETTSKQYPGRREESHREHPQRRHLFFSFPRKYTQKPSSEPWPPTSVMVAVWNKKVMTFLSPLIKKFPYLLWW